MTVPTSRERVSTPKGLFAWSGTQNVLGPTPLHDWAGPWSLLMGCAPAGPGLTYPGGESSKADQQRTPTILMVRVRIRTFW